MKTFRNLVTIFILLTFVLSGAVLAKPVNQADAEKIVKGWLKADSKPLDTIVGNKIAETEVYTDEEGNPVYYIVYLAPTGFVIVSADDLVEPVVGFVNGDGFYDPSEDNTLGALVSRDLPGRIEIAQKLQKELDSGKVKIMASEAVKAKDKWGQFKKKADEPILPMGLGSISDVRVAPLVQSKWDQGDVDGSPCYNYYTPNNYVCGCVATAFAQHLRFHQHPTAGIGVHGFTIYVNGNPQTAYTRGGNGSGGPYSWSNMVLVPESGVTTAQRQAIGALCYDAGVSVHMQYSSGGSGAYLGDVKTALVNTFMYSNSRIGGNESTNIGAGLNGMLNPTLDAGIPCQIAIFSSSAGHAVVADGYGYNGSTLYHHINMGWSGAEDAWYNLPTVGSFKTVVGAIYNTYISGTGEIISGRVTGSSGDAISGATVTATGPGGPYNTTTNSKGIYVFAKVQSNSTYTISVSATNCTFNNQNFSTGTSTDHAITSGNIWGANFVGTCIVPPPSTPPSITYPTSSSEWDFEVSWGSATGATSYQVERSSNGGGSWGQVFSGSGLSFMDHAGNGSYRYRVKASNSGGSSGWCTGTYDCVVTIAPPPEFSESADFYIDGPSGSDLNAGTSLQPWKTLAKAGSEAAAGQKVLVWGDQTYSGTATFNISGTSGNPITVKRDPASGEAVLDGAAGTKAVINTTRAAYVVIDGFTLTNGKYGVYLDGDDCDSWIIKNCKVTANNNNGLYIRNGDDNLFFNNTVYLNNSSNYGIQISSTALNNDVVQCSIYKQKFGMYVSAGSTGGEIMDCIIANNTTYGVRLYNNATVTVSYTDCWGNGTNYSGNGITYGAGDIIANPLWVNPDAGDFHLQGGSPCDNTASDGGDMGYRYGAEPPAPPGQASNPSPANGATGVATNTDLSWTAGTGATSHDVYFGTTSPGTFRGNQTATTYDTGTMAEDTTYYWRIDAKNAQGTTTGVVWSFTTAQAGVPPADYYVDGVNGNDNNTGTSLGQAWKTIQKAANTLTAGKTVLVVPGTYAEAVNHTLNAGSSGSPIVYRAWYESGAVVINATSQSYGFRCAKAYVTFDGFEVYGSNSNGILITGDASDYCIVKNCKVRNNGADGVKVDASDNCSIQNCLIYDNATNGIEAVSNGDGLTIDNCTIYSNNANDGMHIATSDTTVTDCIITSNTQYGIDTYGAVAVGVTYTDTWNNTSGNYDDLTKITVGTGCISLDPLFVNPGGGDFHLQSGSQCKNAASDGGDMGYRYP